MKKKLKALFMAMVLTLTSFSIPAYAAVEQTWDINDRVHADYDPATNTLSIYADVDGADVPNNVTVVDEISEYLNSQSSVTVDFDWNVGNIASNLFSGCTFVGTVLVNGNANGNRQIGSGAFQNCSNLTEVSLQGVGTIGNNAFKNCTALTDVNLGNTTAIGSSAFEGDSYISTLNLKNVKTIASRAFKGCSSLTTINGGSKVTSVDPSAFQVSASSPLLTYLTSEASGVLQNYDYTSANRELYLSSYTITYVPNNGQSQWSEQVPNGTIPSEPNVTNAGREVLGWFTDSALTKQYNFDVAPTSNMTLYCKWSDRTWTVTFETGGSGTAIPSQTVADGAKATLPADPTYYGYKFVGWYTSPDYSIVFSFDQPIRQDTTVYARYTELKLYKVKFKYDDDDDDDVDIEDQKLYAGELVMEPEDPSKDGYEFKGWYKEKSYKHKWHFDTDRVEKNMTLYAKFKSDTIRVTFDTGVPGLTLSPITVDRGERIDEPTPPTADNRTFQYWAKDGEEYNFNDPPKDDMKLTAVWSVSAYTVTFNTGAGESIPSQMVAPGGIASKPTDPIQDNYRFVGWYSDPGMSTAFNFSTPINSDVTLYAKWAELGSAEALADAINDGDEEAVKEMSEAEEGEGEEGTAIPKTLDNSLIPEWFFALWR